MAVIPRTVWAGGRFLPTQPLSFSDRELSELALRYQGAPFRKDTLSDTLQRRRSECVADCHSPVVLRMSVEEWKGNDCGKSTIAWFVFIDLLIQGTDYYYVV